MFRLPQAMLRGEALQPYCIPDAITLKTRGDHLILDLEINEEEGEWIDTGEGRLSALIPLRDAILAGDYRALYLAWLRVCELALDPGEDREEQDADADAEVEEDEEDEADEADEEYADEEDEEYGDPFLTAASPEPPVPPNLKHLDGALRAFIEFLELDPLWVHVAAEASASLRDAAEPLAQWILALPEADCRRLLLRAAGGEPNIALAIRKELRERFGSPAQPAPAGAPRTAGQLLALVQQRRRRAADEQRRKDARARALRLAALAQREAAVWDEVTVSIELRNATGYDHAVRQLRDLHELAASRGEQAAFQDRLARIVEQFSRLSSFRARLVAASLIE